MRDPYEVLGVPKDADEDRIKKAYRALAKKHHPDLHPGDKTALAKFQEIQGAYDILSDKEKRRRFDAGEIDASGAERPPRNFYRAYADGSGGDGAKYHGFGAAGPEGDIDLDDLFSMFGGAAAGARGRGGARSGFKMPGADVSYTLRVSFLDAANGARQRLTLPDGRTIDVTIPEGTHDRQTLRLKGQGQPGIGGGDAGDAYIEIHVEPHAFFTRKDTDVTVEVPVTLDEAVLGAKIEVPTVSGTVSLTVPKGSNTGTTLRLKGRGILDSRTKSRGDQYVKLKVVLPDAPDDALTKFVEEWVKTHKYDVRGKAGMR
jgi:DnaJ-class molecular chaperone